MTTPSKATVLQCKHTPEKRELTPENLERMSAFFHNVLLPVEPHALVTFNNKQACIMDADVAHELGATIACSIPAKAYVGTYTMPTKPVVTVQTLSDYEYRNHWLANYFDVNVDAIERLSQFNPAEHAIEKCPVDYDSPQLPLGNGFYADEDLINHTT